MIARLLRTIAVCYLYYPHRAFIRVIGPRNAIRFSRVTALLHWLCTFLGAERVMRTAVSSAFNNRSRAVPINGSVSRILRRHLSIKHQHFVEWYSYPTPAGRKYVRETYPCLEGREHLDEARKQGRGVVVVMYHFGVGKMIFPALDALGYETYHHVFRGATYDGAVYGKLAKHAMETMAEAEKLSGLKVIYHRPGYTFPLMVRLLKKNAIVGMNADGMTGTEFVELPFLNGTMSFPSGAARLAAIAGAPMVPVFGLHEGVSAHRLIARPMIPVVEDTPEAAREGVRACSQLLEDYVLQYPWAWWTWRRLHVETTSEGALRYTARVNRQEQDSYHFESISALKT